MGLRVNLGAGDDIRDGWLNLDNRDGYDRSDLYVAELPAWQYEGIHGAWRADMRYLDDVTHGASLSDHCAELVLLNHSLHYVTPSDAELVLDHVVRILAPGGRVVIVEADVLGVIEDARQYGERAAFVCDLIGDELEPTYEGKLLRWASWYGERRSLWSWESLVERLRSRGLYVEYGGPAYGDPDSWAGDRIPESFVVVAVK